ncbi:MAG TPA: YggS family pyridoxal phosphate-dependent enzyme [bacterium]
MLASNVAEVRRRVGEACRRAGRDPASVTLLAVTKGVPLERIRAAAALGLDAFGESRVQEARSKLELLGRGEGRRGRWHLIGHLQRNKAKLAAVLFDAVHSADSGELIDALEAHRAAAPQAGTLDVFIQVNVAGEPAKHGCAPQLAEPLASRAAGSAHLRLAGLMAIAPWSDDPESARPVFRRMRELRDEIAAGLGWPATSLALSMGMSEDFDVAVEEGADIVRIGTAIFGARTALGA